LVKKILPMSSLPIGQIVPVDCLSAVETLTGFIRNTPLKASAANEYFTVYIPERVHTFLKKENIAMYPGIMWAGGSLVRVLNNLEVPATSDIDLWIGGDLERTLCALYAADPETAFKYHDCLIVASRGHERLPIQLISIDMAPTHVVEDFDAPHLKAFLHCDKTGHLELVLSRHYCVAWMTKTTMVTNTKKGNYARRVEKAEAMGLSVSLVPVQESTPVKRYGAVPYKAVTIWKLFINPVMVARSLEELRAAYGTSFTCPSGKKLCDEHLPSDSVSLRQDIPAETTAPEEGSKTVKTQKTAKPKVDREPRCPRCRELMFECECEEEEE